MCEGQDRVVSKDVSKNIEKVEECLLVLNQLASWRNKSVRLVAHHSAMTAKRVNRLALSSENDLVGRKQVLKKLTTLLSGKVCDRENDHPKPVRVLVHGPPGIGKTALVRKVANLTSDVLPQQHIFQATTKETLATDIRFFLQTDIDDLPESNEALLFSHFNQFLQKSKDKMLLIFEDVRDPSVLLSHLPEDKHCMLFTSCDDLSWVEVGLVPNCVESIELSSLSASESLELLESILTSKKCLETFHHRCRNPNEKKALVSFLTSDVMLGVPLAIRLFAFELCGKKADYVGKFEAVINKLSTSSRLKADERAAGRIHTRGFHHVVRLAVSALKPGGADLKVCLLASLLPSGEFPMFVLQRACQQIGISPMDLHQSLNSLSNAGLISRETFGWKMHEVVQSLVRNYKSEQVEGVQNEVVCGFVQAMRETTLGNLEKPLSKIKDTWESVCGQGKLPEFAVNGLLNEQQSNMQLRNTIIHFLLHSFAPSLSWEKLDLCWRCLCWCSQRDRCHDGGRWARGIISHLASEKLAGMNTCELSDFSSKESFLNMMSAHWGHLNLSEASAVDTILLELETLLSEESPINPMELLGCVAEALLPSWIFPLENKHAGLAVLRVFSMYGISDRSFLELLRNVNDKTALKCILLYCRALGESGQLNEAAAALKAVIRMWTSRWKLFTVGCKEHLVHQLLSFSVTTLLLEEYNHSLFWSDLAFQINHGCTDSSKMPVLSLLACSSASGAILLRALHSSSLDDYLENVIKIWTGRISSFLHSPTLYKEYDRITFHCSSYFLEPCGSWRSDPNTHCLEIARHERQKVPFIIPIGPRYSCDGVKSSPLCPYSPCLCSSRKS